MRNSVEIFRGGRIPVWNMLGDFDDLFDRAFLPWAPEGTERRTMQPGVSVEETDSAYLVSVDLPGVRKEDVRVDFKESRLTISGERKTGRAVGTFERSFTLPTTVDAQKAEANLEDGVLTVALPKLEAAKARTIEIQTGKSSFFSKLLGTDKADAKTPAAEQQ